MIIYRRLQRTQPAWRQRFGMRVLMIAAAALLQMTSPATSGAAAVGSGAPPAAACSAVLRHGDAVFEARLTTIGTAPAQAAVTLRGGHEWLVETREQGNDAVVEIRDEAGRVLARADHPERRSGTRRLIVSPEHAGSLMVRVTGKEHDAVRGTATVLVVDLAAAEKYPDCGRAYHALVAADADYAVAQQIALGHVTAATQRAREVYLRAADEYRTAQTLLGDSGDAVLRGEAALALAGVQYFDLQNWREAARSAADAENLFAGRDAYRQARAEAVAAAAWMEMAMDFPVDAPDPPDAPDAGNAARTSHAALPRTARKALLFNARQTLRRLVAFHRRRREPYDVALQTNNIGLSYLYEGRFDDCIATARAASRQFARLGERPRAALAWQNRGLCHWGVGHLPAALGAFNRALQDLQPDPYPQIYLITLNNTALINYALGHLDESLRLHDRALELATRSQNRREEAQSLYGIGVTYYALGDRNLAREFLERSLAIRTAALDGRGRRATLRSLATVYADLGDYRKAIQFDREALALAGAPTSRARCRLQLAAHMAQGGDAAGALEILADLIRPETAADTLIRAQARLERAVIERRGGRYAAALRELSIVVPVFRRSGSATDAFTADLESARDWQLAGNAQAAVAAEGHALERSDAIRTQTANPEFRAQLQLPLRAAYDLELDLYWEQFDRAVQSGRERAAARIAAVAFRSADAARARSFADIAAQQFSPAVHRDVAADVARRETLLRELTGLRFALDSRLDRAGSTDAGARELASEIAGLERQVDTLNTAIAARSSRSARDGGSANATLRDVVTAAPPADAAIIAYWLGARSAYAWVASAAGIHWVRLADSATIATQARAFHDSLRGLADVPRGQRLDAGAALYEAILRPLDAWLEPYKRWFFVPDAALDYVPFAALHPRSGSVPRFVVSAHDIALAPAAWLLLRPPQPRPKPGEGRVLLVSDPVYELSDPRLRLPRAPDALSHAGAAAVAVPLAPQRSYRRLPGTAREATAIQAEFPAPAVDAYNGLQATRDRLLQLDWSRYRFIHIATHGYLDAQLPQLSALILSTYDQRGEPIEEALRTADVSALTLTADVAVFSGCDTALGKDVLNEGMVGIAYAALARGAGAVVSSLWQVSDEMGANLMTEFYRHLMRDAMSPVAALGASMRSVLERNPTADPALWAAFQVSVAELR